MTLYAAQEELLKMLSNLYDIREAGNITHLVMEHITGLQKTDRFLNKNTTLDPHQQNRYSKIYDELHTGRPVQYVLEEAWFMGMKFYVNESVLIPRPETEELVEWIRESTRYEVRSTNHINPTAILDIGTGSGCIPVALKKINPHLQVAAVDVSNDALAVAKRNAVLQEAEIDFKQLDFLQENNWDDLPVFDIIVSNPPYIRQAEGHEMAKHVTDFEPSIALFVPDNDALIFYRKIALFSKHHLAKNGQIFLEINEQLGKETTSLFNEHGFATELRKDMQGKERMVKIVNGE